MKKYHIALYTTTGPRRKDHVAVLYLAADRDWSARQRERNGNQGLPIAMAEMTKAAYDYIGHRATSLRYSGIKPADLNGMAEDLKCLGFCNDTVSAFVDAARPTFGLCE